MTKGLQYTTPGQNALAKFCPFASLVRINFFSLI
jgi:hypothetical protein